MKSKQDFSTEEEYLEYLRTYISSQILIGFFWQPNRSQMDIAYTMLIDNVIFASDELIKKLGVKK